MQLSCAESFGRDLLTIYVVQRVNGSVRCLQENNRANDQCVIGIRIAARQQKCATANIRATGRTGRIRELSDFLT